MSDECTPNPDDQTTALPNLTPTEPSHLAWSAEQFEPEPNASAEPAGVRPGSARGRLALIGALGFAVWLLVTMCSSNGDHSTSPSMSAAPSAPPTHETMPGDGTYSIGGIDGKDWGVWESVGGADNHGCQWSIRAVNRYTAGQILDSGETGVNLQTRVNIQPLPDSSSITGESHGFRVVFMTSGCGSWRWVG